MKSSILAGIVLVSLQAASAAIIYTQPSVWSGNGTNVGSGWTSQLDASNSGFRTFDNFTLGGGATINQASWRGMYLNNADLSNGTPNTSSWTVGFFADSGGSPGTQLSSTTLTSAQVTSQILGSGMFGNNTVTVFEFTALLTSFNALGGTHYWFSPVSSATTFSPFFSWIQGTGGDGNSFQNAYSAGSVSGSFVRSGDRAFTLSSVPEPATPLLIGAGLAALALVRRRLRIS
jgi:hypothetical protein